VTLTNQNFTHEDLKKRLNSANACNHSRVKNKITVHHTATFID